MPQFPRSTTKPMRPESYRRIARVLRGIAVQIDYASNDDTKRDILTAQLNRLRKLAAAWWLQHNQ